MYYIRLIGGKVLRLLGFKLIRPSNDFDAIINPQIQQARASVRKNCPDPAYLRTYHKHEVASRGPVPALIYLYAELWKRNNTPPAAPKVLDIGCAYGTYLAYSRLLGFEVYGIDFVPLSQYLGAQTIEDFQIHFQELSIEKDQLPFPDNSFDVVHLAEVIEHFNYQPLDVLRKIHRVLKNDGMLFITTPALGWMQKPEFYNCPFEEIPAYQGQDHTFVDKHMKIYSKDELHRLLVSAKFQPYVGFFISAVTGREGLYAIATKV